MNSGLANLFLLKSRDILNILLGKWSESKESNELDTGYDVDNILPLTGPYQLNSTQLAAVKMALREQLSIVHGPPGTGKTFVCVAIIYNLVKQKPYSKILVCTPSNDAVDILAEMLDAQGIPIVRLFSERYKYIEKSTKRFSPLHIALAQNKYLRDNYEKYDGKLMEDEEYEKYHCILADEMTTILVTTNVTLSTCICSGREDFKDIEYDVVLIDEAAQATEPETLVPLSLHNAAKVILSGDHKQLGSVILSKEAKQHKLEISLFERLLKLNVPTTFLNQQYRMAPQIAEFPSKYFYDGKLENGISDSDRRLDVDLPFIKNRAFVFVNISGKEDIMHTSYFNRNQTAYIIKLVTDLITGNIVQAKDIGVISPYEGQKRHLIEQMSREANNSGGELKEILHQVEIENIDGFQGREKDVIIFSTVRSNEKGDIGFLRDRRRLNVSLTRAKFKCFVIGDMRTLRNDEAWNAMIKHAYDNDYVYNE